MKTRNLFWLSAALLMAACTNEEDISMASSSAIQFNAAISESRVIGNTWEVGDKVGISMKVGDDFTEKNKLYTANSTQGTFQTTGKALRFPDEIESNVTFYAYYPYNETQTDKITFEVDGKTDVLWAEETVTADNQSLNTVELSFSHALSKVILETEDFPDDIEVTLSESCSQATLDITTGEVQGITGETEASEETAISEEESYSVELVKGDDGNYSAIVLPCTSTTKTLIIASVSLEKQWTYTIESAAYEGGHQYVYKATYKNANGVQFEQNGIKGWEEDGNADPSDLGDGTESERPISIAEWLDGKTIKPNLNYAYDWVASLNDGRGEFTPSANFGIDNIGKGTAYGQWTQELYDALNKSSITFTYNKDNDVLTATSVDNGTNKGNITVTVDDTNKTLQFSENPLTYNWLFTNNTEAKWQLVVKREDCLFTMTNLGSVTTKELFANNEVHMSYYSSSDSKYLVINYVLQNDATNEQ